MTLRNFRCFGDSPTTVELAEYITALVGANGSGKTALLTALTRLFGTTQSMRTIRRSDFLLCLRGVQLKILLVSSCLLRLS